MNEDHINEAVDFARLHECLAFLLRSGIEGDHKRLTQLVRDYDCDLLTLNVLVSYLKHWYDGSLTGLETIPVLDDKEQQGRPLRRLLSAFEIQFRGCAELPLLYLLSLSDGPVLQQDLEETFHAGLLKRLLTKKDEYKELLNPLLKLNAQGWAETTKRLNTLCLIECSVSEQGNLLSIAKPMRSYFRNVLKIQKCTIYHRAYEDMMDLITEDTTELRSSDISVPDSQLDEVPRVIGDTHTAGKKLLVLDKETFYKALSVSVVWKKDEEIRDAQSQLGSLRHSLKALRSQADALSALIQSPVLTEQDSGHAEFQHDEAIQAA